MDRGAGRSSGPVVPETRIVIHSVRSVARAARSGFRRYPRALVDAALGISPLSRVAPPIVDLEGWQDRTLAALWLGHGSVLLRHGGKTILMDPVFADRIGLEIAGRTLGLPRLAALPVARGGLPPVDYVLLSHAHFDHLCVPTLRKLVSPRTTVVTARATRDLIPAGFGRVIELDWGQFVHLGEGSRGGALRIAALRPRHWGARAGLDRHRGYNSYVLRDRDGRGVLLAGDTAMTDAFDGLRDVELAALGIGSYEPWKHAHATPEEAWAMFRASGASRMLPIHHLTFELGDEPRHEPMERLRAAAGTEMGLVAETEIGRVWDASARE